MKIKRDKAIELMNTYCAGNYNRFARELDIDRSQLYHFMTSGVGGGRKLIGCIMKFCKSKRLDYEDYFEL
jgi:hypothetical protein